jgi:hypothetical protein
MDYEVAYWFERARQGGVDTDTIALAGLGSDSYRARAVAVAALAELGEQFAEALIPALADDYPQVRAAVIHALEKLRPEGAWREHLEYECYVPAGECIMGDDLEDSRKQRVHTVSLDAFYIGKYLVTNADYRRYMISIGRSFDIPAGKADYPVNEISWYDARDYAAWAGQRLLSEAEWEKAASWDEQGSRWERGRKRQYPWGDGFDENKCNTRESGILNTTPVGSYSPRGDSPYGCADMAGNVFEWTSSLYQAYPYQACDGREDPVSGGPRVLRGGSWGSDQVGARCAARYNSDPNFRRVSRGCRVGVSPALQLPTSGLLDSGF